MTAPTPRPQPGRLADVDLFATEIVAWTVRVLRWENLEVMTPKPGEVHKVPQPAIRLHIPPEDHPSGDTYVDVVGAQLVASLRPLLDGIVAGRAQLTLRRRRARFGGSFDVRYPRA